MDGIDRKLLNLIQRNFPLTPEPFARIGQQMGLAEEEVIQRIRRLKTLNVIHRIGASMNSRRLGMVGSLCAARVPENRVKHFVGVVNSHPGVTHNYRRNHTYNVWFTLTAESLEEIEEFLEEVRERTGVKEIVNLPSLRTFKIKVQFDF
ncbi:MAG: AsnC family transcriptional regulator [Deltaproteobacteria bacterium]|nr:AsnC family transcriptional regulator [Deltaproteobacteria bacterium]